MNICLEGPKGDWDWFDADLREPDLGLDFNKIKAVCKTSNPMVIDIEYDDNEVDLDGILKFDGMGWTSVSALIREAEELAQYDDDALQKIARYMRVKSGDLEDAKNHYDNYWTVCTDDPDPTSLAYEMVKEFGISEEDAANYFDYEAFGRDLLIGGYETDETDEYTVGEEYIDSVYGDVANYIAEVGVDNIENYFDFNAYGRNLAFSWSYDDVSGCWMSESVKNKNVNMSKLTESIDLTQSFKDPQGMFGEPGAVVTAQELKNYWDEEYEWDPSLQDFNSFEDWYEDTIEWFEPIIESTKKSKVKKSHIKESYSDSKYTGNTWADFINNIEANSNYKVDSAYRRKYDQWIELIDNNGKIYDAEVTMYKDRLGNITYELTSYDITPSYQYESIKRSNNRKRINKRRYESTNRRCKTRRIVKESITKHQYDILQNACMNCNTINDLDSILGSLLTVDKNLYLKYSNKAVHDNYSASALAKDISDDLYYAFSEYND